LNVLHLSKKSKVYADISNSPNKNKKYKTRFLLKSIWTLPLFILFIYFLSSMFISSVYFRIVISVVLSIYPWYESMSAIYLSGYRHTRTQLLVLLQVLCTSVSSGYSIEKSLVLVRPVIEHTFGKKSGLIKPLIELENNLKVHMSLEKSLSIFAESINFPETVPVFHALAISGQIGNNSLAILRSSCQMLSEMNAVQSEINASNAGKNAEALILCLMPFCITFALDRMSNDYLTLARSTSTGSVMLSVAFAICVTASALLFKFMSHTSEGNSKREKTDDITSNIKTPLTFLMQKIMPISFISSRHELFNELSVNPNVAYEMYLKKQIKTVLLSGIIFSGILLLLKKSLIWIIPLEFGIIFLNSKDIRHSVDIKRENMMQDIPLFICLISTLLEAGMQLPKTIDICARAFDDNKSLSLEIKNIRAMMLSGISASDAMENFSLRIQIPEAQAALLLVARYGRLGTSEVLNLLSLQSSSCWNLCRNAARKKQEREALALLLPMTLDFICVLIVATVPAIISLGI